LAVLATLLWLMGFPLGKVLLTVSSGAFGVMILAALFIERRERRRDSEVP
jgi:hypothetical protein